MGQYTEGYEEGKNTMRQIIAKRANLSLFDEDALVELIDAWKDVENNLVYRHIPGYRSGLWEKL